MPIDHVLTIQGGRTSDNRDCTGFASQEHHHLYLLADGSTSSSQSAELAKALIAHMEGGFGQLSARQLHPDRVEAALLQLLSEGHDSLARVFAPSSTSYLIVLFTPDEVLAIHAGDCCLGRVLESCEVEWLTLPHCRANWRGDLTHAQIAIHADRHSLTRCFSARREHSPQVSRFQVSDGSRWVLATDGFWADLCPVKQRKHLESGALLAPDSDDDLTIIDVRF